MKSKYCLYIHTVLTCILNLIASGQNHTHAAENCVFEILEDEQNLTIIIKTLDKHEVPILYKRAINTDNLSKWDRGRKWGRGGSEDGEVREGEEVGEWERKWGGRGSGAIITAG